ncbi:MAG TPA: UDP-N-acetylglucosamine--N-acetylmuramyl-(pentapeptide) pyrophosphoryl-undecaprenol N-acetylglucosamine transferase [Lichenihabitans sp.]|nr:UDP-N-acetylglucosamine--N-acetylmuramyl-(pentapeptide) pyrophosphoryl-undecaprenol N-acetylglucosamine transferase [Lichenihabitans sp.]
MNAARGTVLLAAGGTGGHLFPAEALARALGGRGIAVELMTDSRALQYGRDFPARACHAVSSATPTGGSAVAKAKSAATLVRGTLAAYAKLRRIRPSVVVGFGGYPTVPPVMAAALGRIPVVLHEQNAVLGRANRFVAGRAAALATGFPTLGKASDAIRAKATYTGNPVRPAVFAAAAEAFPPYEEQGGPLNLLVTGGSQGARVMADVVPAAIEELDPETRRRLVVVQQARGEDERRVRETYARLGVTAEVAPFFADLPARMAAAHLVIARAGASTVSELATVGRASILVPFPHALDQDQAANAAVLAESGSAVVCDQSAFTPDWLAVELIRVLSMPADLFHRAQAARSSARWDSTERLADLVLAVAGHCSSEGQRP